MNVMMNLRCVYPSSNENEYRVDLYEMAAEFAAIPRPGDKIVLPLSKDEERIPDQPLEFKVETVSWEVSCGQATPILHFDITSECGSERQWMAARGWTHVGFQRIRQ